MFYVFYFFLICCLCGSVQQHPEGMETLYLGWPKSMVSTADHTGETLLNMKLLYIWWILFQANPVSLSHGCCKYPGQGKICSKFEMHCTVANQGTGNRSESASLLYIVNMNIWAEVCQQMPDAILMNTLT